MMVTTIRTSTAGILLAIFTLWKGYEISDEDTSGLTVSRVPGTRVHFNECKLQQKHAKRLAESRHTYPYHDADLNIVSQDGTVFEPAIRTDK